MLLKILAWIGLVAAAMLLLVAHVLGLTTWAWSAIFPVRYNMAISAVVNFQGERLSTRAVVQCQIIDQTKTIASNYDVKMLADPPIIALKDGSVLVLSIATTAVCFWHREPPRIGDAYRFDPDDQFVGRMKGKTIGIRGRALRFNNRSQPTTLEMTSLRGLMRGTASGLSLESLTMAATSEASTHTAASILPWAKEVETVANRQHSPELRFFGVRAEVQQLPPGAQCDGAPAPTTTELIKLDPFARCACPGNHPDNQRCAITLGSLKPQFSADFSRIEFNTGDIRPDVAMTFVREKHLLDRKAPTEAAESLSVRGTKWQAFSFTWRPLVCIDGQCEPLRGVMQFIDPARRLVLRLDQGIYHGNGLPTTPASTSLPVDD